MSTSFSDGFPHAHPNTSQIDMHVPAPRRRRATPRPSCRRRAPPRPSRHDEHRRPPSPTGRVHFLRFVRHLKWKFIFVRHCGRMWFTSCTIPSYAVLCAAFFLPARPKRQKEPASLPESILIPAAAFSSYFSRFVAEPHLSAAARCSGEKERKQGGQE
jgi:hypothetical protein